MTSPSRTWLISGVDVLEGVDSSSSAVLEEYRTRRFEANFDRAGCRSAWLLQRIDHHEATGRDFPAVCAVYEVDAEAELDLAELAAPTEWGPVESSVRTWAPIRRDLLAVFDASPSEGDYWANVRVDFTPVPYKGSDQELQFNRWYSHIHLPEIAQGAGYHRGWRTGEGAESPWGEGNAYWAVYELDHPSDLMRPVTTKPLWDGLWHDNVPDAHVSRTYFQVMSRRHKR